MSENNIIRLVDVPLIGRVPDVTNIIDDILIGERHSREKTSHYPSGARVMTPDGVFGECLRKQYYAWSGEETTEIDITGLWKMDMGNAIHEWIGDKLKDVYELYEEYTVEFSPPYLKSPIRGRIDNLIVSPELNFGVEIKSKYGRGITSRHSGVKYYGPSEGHLLQALIYLYISKLSDEEKAEYMPIDAEQGRPLLLPELDFFVIYYIARDNAYRLSYYIDLKSGEEIIAELGSTILPERADKIRDMENIPVVSGDGNIFVYEDISFKEIVKSYMLAEKYVSEKVIPPREYRLDFEVDENDQLKINAGNSDWQCRYCSYMHPCYFRDS